MQANKLHIWRAPWRLMYSTYFAIFQVARKALKLAMLTRFFSTSREPWPYNTVHSWKSTTLFLPMGTYGKCSTLLTTTDKPEQSPAVHSVLTCCLGNGAEPRLPQLSLKLHTRCAARGEATEPAWVETRRGTSHCTTICCSSSTSHLVRSELRIKQYCLFLFFTLRKFNLLTLKFKKDEICLFIGEVVRIGSIIILHLSKLWKAKFVILCDATFLLQGKFEIDHFRECKRHLIPPKPITTALC